MTRAPGNTPFSAADPTLGYLYQVRLALLLALRRLKTDQNFLVSIETLDDVTFETAGGDATDLLQTKHHRTGTANLTDASADLWKTLRIWFSSRAAGQMLPHTKLFLVTTGIAPPDSAASRLRSVDRNVPAAQAALDATAQISANVTNRAAYQVYLDATPQERSAILSQIEVLDGAATVSDLDAQLRAEVLWAANRDRHTAFLDRLEGWWLRRVLRQLTDSPTGRIGAAELESKMSDLRESFKQESLPIDEDLLDFTLDDATREAHDGRIFVWQMEIIKAGKMRIAAAVRDYYRAFVQRSRWLRHDLVVDMDLSKYEKRLSEEWEVIFEAARDELGTSPSQEIKEGAARSVLAWAERAQVSIRPQVTEPFVCRGSLHMLSDEGRVGWHPEFQDRLAVLLRNRSSTGGTT